MCIVSDHHHGVTTHVHVKYPDTGMCMYGRIAGIRLVWQSFRKSEAPVTSDQ